MPASVMDELTPPSLPTPEAEGLTDAEALLERHEPTSSQHGEGNSPEIDRPSAAAVDLSTWAHRVANANVDGTRRTICRLGVPGLEGLAATRGSDAARDALEQVRIAVARAHDPCLGVVSTEGGELIFLLPDGLPWSAVATTVQAALSGIDAMDLREDGDLSAGLAETDTDGRSIQQVLERTALGLAASLEEGGGARMIQDDVTSYPSREAEVEKHLHEALETGRGLRLVYQPKLAVEGGALVGAEALLRSESDSLGAVGPAEFIPIARRVGLLAALDRWALRRALAEMEAWRRRGVLHVPVSVNVGADAFLGDEYAAILTGVLEATDLQARDVRIEVCTPRVLDRMERAAEQIQSLRALGVGISLDDFGQVEMTAADLREFPVDVLKVHRSLVEELTESDSAAILVRSVLSLAKVLGMQTVAAGVETEEQLERLRELGCDAVQGFLLSAPLEHDAFEEMLARSSA